MRRLFVLFGISLLLNAQILFPIIRGRKIVSGGPLTPFLSYGSGFAAGTGAYDGYVGFIITVGASPLVVKALGRVFLTGNSGTHTLKIVLASSGADVAGSSVSLSMTGGTNNVIKYANLGSSVTLAASTTYYVVSSETSAGDQWSNNTPVSPTAVGTVPGVVYGTGPGAWSPQTVPNYESGGVNLEY